MTDQNPTTDAKVIADDLEAAILRELYRWDGGDLLPEIASPLATHLRRRVVSVLKRRGVIAND